MSSIHRPDPFRPVSPPAGEPSTPAVSTPAPSPSPAKTQVPDGLSTRTSNREILQARSSSRTALMARLNKITHKDSGDASSSPPSASAPSSRPFPPAVPLLPAELPSGLSSPAVAPPVVRLSDRLKAGGVQKPVQPPAVSLSTPASFSDGRGHDLRRALLDNKRKLSQNAASYEQRAKTADGESRRQALPQLDAERTSLLGQRSDLNDALRRFYTQVADAELAALQTKYARLDASGLTARARELDSAWQRMNAEMADLEARRGQLTDSARSPGGAPAGTQDSGDSIEQRLEELGAMKHSVLNQSIDLRIQVEARSPNGFPAAAASVSFTANAIDPPSVQADSLVMQMLKKVAAGAP